ncbi:hypothetical protein GGP41_003395 [Bipolaris sorokiniana]|uniref:Zn(2)-C6 fungal-type domain-containing protein n=2 Tax=Cochliobolus sativus TaxID=45130 RepID=A0A8H5ZF44_COCSA|nr:uncharacterized protein COCSADRAFT_349856 [Bipolaris sorokiniana ND90Pr]EMD68389.1 hypothetical protein COCSADRAFT_349856 [Bipolaris sorokiniana ND90Pr]KAF5847069.1 hypothetical protein GGP41_003395 [Bipolaris sorokiniana]
MGFNQLQLRQACDSCTAAKVKCDKGHPACQRCLDNEEYCQYSPSRRHGRRPRRSRATIQQPTPSSIASEPEVIPSQPSKAASEPCITQQSVDLLSWDTLNLGPFSENTSNRYPSDSELDMSNFLLWSNFGSSDCMSQSDTHSILHTNASLLDQNLTEGEGTVSADMFSHCGVEQSKNNTEHAVECESRALAVLRSLLYRPKICTSEWKDSTLGLSPKSAIESTSQASIHPVHSMDTVLATNKAALNELTQLLECHCAENSHIALLHLTILSKIVFWYNVVVTKTYNSERVDLKTMKIRFGALDLDDDDSTILHRAVLFRELQKAGNVVQAFEVRFSSPGASLSGKELPWGRQIVRAIREDLDRCVGEIEKR